MDIGHLLFSFDGRINRAKWWLGILFLIIAYFILIFVLSLFIGGGFDPASGELPSSVWIGVAIIYALLIWPSLALYAKRWHDRGKSGWWTLIVFVPIVGSIWILVELGCLSGDEGANDYGPDPLA